MAMAVRALVTVMLFTTNRMYRGLDLWAMASALSAGAFALLFIRSAAPDVTAIAIAQNTAIVAAVSFEYAGTVAFLGGNPRWRPIAAGITAIALVMSFFVFVHDDIEVRTAFLHVGLVVLTFLTAWTFIRSDIRAIKSTRYMMATILSIAGLYYLLRLVEAATRTSAESFHAPSLLMSVELFVALFEGLLLTFGLVLMVGQRLNAEMREARDRFEQLYTMSPDASLITRLEDARIVRVNDALAEMTGHTPSELLGMSSVDVFWEEPSDRENMVDTLVRQGLIHDVEVRLVRKDGSRLRGLTSARLLDIDGAPHILSVTRDITDRKRLETELRRQATTDSLTGIANRRHFLELATRETARAARLRTPMSVFIIDIDNLKEVNDAFGHAAGDAVLAAFARECLVALRETDLVARFGGDEFVVLLPDTEATVAQEVAERVRLHCSRTVTTEDGRDVSYSCCLGVASREEASDTLDEILARADRALYKAKASGRNRVEYATRTAS
jgi:diguanylate cyclase (GGDEF)-like protein/PAS domain S-box-containing protein